MDKTNIVIKSDNYTSINDCINNRIKNKNIEERLKRYLSSYTTTYKNASLDKYQKLFNYIFKL